MDYEKIKQQLANGVSYIEISKELGMSVTTLKSRCSKIGIYARSEFRNRDVTVCTICKQTKERSAFYVKKGGSPYSHCKDCIAANVLKRTREYKLKCLEYKGGKCERCGYDKHPSALQFHHLDPQVKEFGISARKTKQFDDATKLELDKCQLLCANCHAEEHYS